MPRSSFRYRDSCFPGESVGCVMVLVLRRETSRRPSDCGGLPRTRYRRLPANGGVRLEGSAWRARPSHGRSAVSQPSPWHLPSSPVPMTWVSRAVENVIPAFQTPLLDPKSAAPPGRNGQRLGGTQAAAWFASRWFVSRTRTTALCLGNRCSVICHTAPRLASAIVPSLAPAPTPRHCAESRRVAKRLSMLHHRAKWHMTYWGRKQDLSLDW